MQFGPLTPTVVGKLLVLLSLPVRTPALEEACRLTAQGSQNPIEQMGKILRTVNRRNAQGAMLRWTQFDSKHLPVLLWRDEQWFLAEAGPEKETVFLTAEDESTQTVHSDELKEDFVLWLQHKIVDSIAREKSFSKSALSLIITETFRTKRWLWDVIAATLVVNIMNVGTSLFAMQVYDRVVPTKAYATFYTLALGMVVLVGFDWILKFMRSGILDRVALDVDDRITIRLFERVLRLRLDSRPKLLGTLAAQVNGLASVRAFFSSTVIFALVDLPFAFFFMAIIAVVGGTVGYAYLLLFVVVAAVGLYGKHKLKLVAKNLVFRDHEQQGFLVNSIRGAETIQTSGSVWKFKEQWDYLVNDIAKFKFANRRIIAVVQITTGTCATVAYVLAIYLGVMEIGEGNLSVGGLIACTILGGRVVGPISQAVGILSQLEGTLQSLAYVDSLLMRDLDREEDANLLSPDIVHDRYEFTGVKFSYENSPVLRLNINNLVFNAGDRVILLGANGSGKSTFLKVAAGLYKPTGGRVGLNGADLWEIDPQLVSDWIGYLPQDIHMFKGTLRSNLSIAGAVKDSRLLEVIQELNIDAIAKDSPRSLEMEITEDGNGLSEGQKQLVALARLFLSPPRVWLLDEPTSNMDNSSENMLIERLRKYVKPTDILIIATHRPALLTLANRVVVMQSGTIVLDDKPEVVLRQLGVNVQGQPPANAQVQPA